MNGVLTEQQLEQAKAQARRECAEQGIPYKVEDPVVLARIGRLVAGAARAAQARGAA